MSVADRIAVMNKGKVEQFDTPVAIYDRPQTLFVNGFIGTTNLLNGRVAALDDGTATVALDAGATPAACRRRPGLGVGAPVLMSVRPEQLALSSDAPARELARSSPASACRSARSSCTRRAPPTARRSRSSSRAAPRRPRPAPRLLRAAARRPPLPVPAFHLIINGVTPCMFSRRSLLAGATALGGASLLPAHRPRQGQRRRHDLSRHLGGGLSHRSSRRLLKKKDDIDLELAPLFAVDQIAKAKAARGAPPFDVFVLDPGPRIVGIEGGLFEKFDGKKLTNLSKLPAGLVDEWGVCVSAQVVGIAYNPKKLPAPKGWKDLLQRSLGVAPRPHRLPDDLRHVVADRDRQAVRRLADQRRAGARRAQEGAAQDRRGRPAGRHARPVPARPVRRDVHQHPDRRDAQGQAASTSSS